jgi:hypothetical protein
LHQQCRRGGRRVIWENACDREVLKRELDQNYANTEEALEEAQVKNAVTP